MTVAEGNRYRFPGAVFDAAAGSLTVDGRIASLRPRTAAVLRCLLDRAGEVVCKDDLLREVWADLVVTENSLAQCVKEIRRELGDAQEAVLRTVHRRGYVLDASVECAKDPPAGASSLRRHDGLSLMVLPLVNVGGDPGQDYFAESLTEELTTDLGRLPGAFVISRGTAQAFRDRRMNAQEIGRQLGVNYLVEGSVRRSESEIIVNLALIDAAAACERWAERFSGPRSQVEFLQRSMSAKIAQILHLELLDAEGERVGRGEGKLDAQDLATRAWSLWYRAAPEINPEADELIRRAIELDPRCTFAWVMKANGVLMRLATRTAADPARALDEGEHAAAVALSLDPDHTTANGSMGAILAYRGRFEEALGFLERQTALNPNLAIAQQWTGIVHILMGNARLALRPLEMCIEISPRDPRLSTFIRNLALAHLHLERDAEALIHAERSVTVPRPWARSYETLAMAYAANGLIEEATAAVAVLLRHWPGYSVAAHRAEMMSHRPVFVTQRERLLEGLRCAGLPGR